ncbi:MAG: eight-cysteine-cluster domain-containing protein [Patescibacteria group bacterium]
MKKALIILAILIVLAGICFGLRFLIGGPEDTWICENDQWVKHGNPNVPMPTEPCGESKNNETADWQAYQSSRGFSIKCPADFSGYSDLPNDTTAYQDGLKSGCLAKDNGLGTIEIVAWTKFTEEIWGKNFTLDDFLKNEREIIKDVDSEFKEETISLDNNPATKITYIEKLGSNEIRKVINVYSQKGKLIYKIHIVIFPQAEARYAPIMDKILSTFKFTGLADTADEDFCGLSTYGNCSVDSDCVVGGCSAQVCQSKNEEPTVTTCEYKDCYNAGKYELKCKCLAQKCQWAK